MAILFKNIKQLLQVRPTDCAYVAGSDMKVLPKIDNAFLRTDQGRIVDFGPMHQCPEVHVDTEIIDATGRFVLPTWCDSHTHIVYAGNREREFVQRIAGKSYAEIAEAGGGILNSAKKLQETSEDALLQQSKSRLVEVIAQGTGAVEIKSGYGLTVEAEMKMLRVIKKLKEISPIPIKSTFLAAHAIPTAYKSNKQAFLNIMLEEALPKIADFKLANFIDVFCEKGYFDLSDTLQVIRAGKKYGLPAKIHVNQFNAFGGVGLCAAEGALSVDHLEMLTEADVEALASSNTMPVSLPACSLFLSIPYTPARKIIDAGLPLALATDYNPGSCPSGNMNLVVALACMKLKMLPEEAINSATINGAYAMQLEKEVGSITKGKRANLMLTKQIPSYAFLPYGFGANQIEDVFINGERM